jgi:hypothetical protein
MKTRLIIAICLLAYLGAHVYKAQMREARLTECINESEEGGTDGECDSCYMVVYGYSPERPYK